MNQTPNKWIGRLSIIYFIAVVFSLHLTHGAETNIPRTRISVQIPTTRSPFWDDVELTYHQQSFKIFDDRFGPIRGLDKEIDALYLTQKDAIDRYESNGKGALTSTLVNTAREMAVESVFVESIAGWFRGRFEHFSNLVKDSVGGVDEEALNPTDISYTSSEHRYWKAVSEERRWRYGVRPWREKNQYAYVSYGIADGYGEDYLLANLRYYWPMFATEHRMELSLLIPVDHLFNIHIGTSFLIDSGKTRYPIIGVSKVWRNGSELFAGVNMVERTAQIGYNYRF